MCRICVSTTLLGLGYLGRSLSAVDSGKRQAVPQRHQDGQASGFQTTYSWLDSSHCQTTPPTQTEHAQIRIREFKGHIPDSKIPRFQVRFQPWCTRFQRGGIAIGCSIEATPTITNYTQTIGICLWLSCNKILSNGMCIVYLNKSSQLEGSQP